MVGLIGDGFNAGEAARMSTSPPPIIRVLVVLAIGQLISWGALGLPAVIGTRIAADLGISVATVFAGPSVFYVIMGLLAPMLASSFARHGARNVMVLGNVCAAPGFALLSLAASPTVYFAAWAVLGTAGAAMLSTAAYILLNEVAGRRSRGAMGALMLVTGLSSSIFWPTTAFLSEVLGWRQTCLVYGGAMLLICMPLNLFGLPRRKTGRKDAVGSADGGVPAAAAGKSTFYLIASAIALNAFVTFGFSAILIELLKSEGLPAPEAIAFASALGIVQVGARGADFLGGGRWDGVTTAIAAGAMLPLAMLLMMAGGGTRLSVGAFIALYGVGSGALAVARATIPLAFYDSADYARAASRIALPLNLLLALAPPLMAGLLVWAGAGAVLGLAILLSVVALAIMVVLSRRRPSRELSATR